MRHRALLLTGLGLLVGGLVLAAVAGPVVVVAVGWALFGIGGVLLVSLAFLLVGESEDRDRMKHPGG
jgi:hypothetical protein